MVAKEILELDLLAFLASWLFKIARPVLILAVLELPLVLTRMNTDKNG